MPKDLIVEQEEASNTPVTGSKKGRMILKDTVEKFSNDVSGKYKQQAEKNHERWEDTAQGVSGHVRVINGDWGDVALNCSKATGAIYAVLNSANAVLPGGFYLEGWGTQEENMYRRTNCHFYVRNEELDEKRELYTKEVTDLINGVSGHVYLDKQAPRICIKASAGPNDSGYDDLPASDYFLFYELKSAAEEVSKINPFNKESMRRKIAAQLDTLVEAKVRCVVLGAFGCGVFGNPADKVALIYLKELQKRIGDFDDVVFAVYSSEFGPDNFTPFKKVLDGISLNKKLSQEALFEIKMMYKPSGQAANSLFIPEKKSKKQVEVDDSVCSCNMM